MPRPTPRAHMQHGHPHIARHRSLRRTQITNSRPQILLPHIFRRLDTVDIRPVEFYTENIDLVDTESCVQWGTCKYSSEQGAILERAVAHLDDWKDALERERARHMDWSVARYQQAMQHINQEPFVTFIVGHWIHAAEAARFDKSWRSWAAIRKILDRMKDNRRQYCRVRLAERRALASTTESEAMLDSLDRRLARDARRAETLARTDDPIEYPNGIWGDLSPSDIVSDYDSDGIEEAQSLGEGDTGSDLPNPFAYSRRQPRPGPH